MVRLLFFRDKIYVFEYADAITSTASEGRIVTVLNKCYWKIISKYLRLFFRCCSSEQVRRDGGEVSIYIHSRILERFLPEVLMAACVLPVCCLGSPREVGKAQARPRQSHHQGLFNICVVYQSLEEPTMFTSFLQQELQDRTA